MPRSYRMFEVARDDSLRDLAAQCKLILAPAIPEPTEAQHTPGTNEVLAPKPVSDKTAAMAHHSTGPDIVQKQNTLMTMKRF